MRYRYRPRLESLEDRLVPTYAVAAGPYQPTLLIDGGPGVQTVINHADDTTAVFSLGSAQFNFFGTAYSSLFVSSNGLITFGSADAAFNNSDLTGDPSQASIAPLWDDWVKLSGGPMVMGKVDAANHRAVLQWDQVDHFLSNAPVTFQAVLQLDTGTTPGAITFNYVAVNTGDQFANGASATVGIKDAGTQGPDRNLMAFNGTNALVGNGQAVQFSWILPTPTPAISGLDPASVTEHGPDQLVTVNGSSFLNTAVVRVNGTSLPTTFVSAGQLRATVPAADLAEEGTLAVTVFNPGSPGVESTPVTLTVADAPLAAAAANLTTTEGQALPNSLVATFTDPGSDGTTADYSATVTWDDGGGRSHTVAGTVQAAGGNAFTVYAANDNPYAEEGSYAVMVTVTDVGGSRVTVAGTVTVADAPLAATGATVSAVEGVAFTGVVASFTDADPNGSVGDYAATIDWGDGQTSAGGVTANGSGGFDVTGTHTYAEEGAYPITVHIADAGGANAAAPGSAVVADALLSATPVAVSAVEGTAFSGPVAAFHDPGGDGTVADYSATIDWGDGTTSAGVVSTDGAGGYLVSGGHTYGEEGSYAVGVTVTDVGGTSAAVTGSASVADAPLTPTGTQVRPVEGLPFIGVIASFTEANPFATADDYRATIDWGDGTTSAGTVTANDHGGFDVTGTHTSAEAGNFAVTVTITDDGGASAVADSSASVADAPLTAAGKTVAAVEGSPFTGVVASFTDADPNGRADYYAAVIDWGDGSTSAGSVTPNAAGGFDVVGSHTYAEEGTYHLAVGIADFAGASVGVSGTAVVADAALSGAGSDVAAVEGAAFAGVVASFTDANPLAGPDDFTAMIHWGDGTTSAGTVVAAADGFSILGAHTYAEEGTYALGVTVQDVGGSTATFAATAAVADAPLAATGGTVAATEGAPFTGVVAFFTDADPNGTAGDYSATIDWGDGQTSAGIVAGDGGGFTVTGTHTYAGAGGYSLAVQIADAGGATAAAAGTATVADAPLTATSATLAATEGAAFTALVASFTDRNPLATAGDFTAQIDWGDGTVSAGAVTANAAGGFDVVGTHTYADEGSNAILVTIHDVGGSSVTAAGAVAVADAPLTARAAPVTATEGTAFAGTVATFTDADPSATAGQYAATITWCDGGTSAGTVAGDGHGGFVVTGAHTYAEEGSYPVGVVIQDVGGSSAAVATTATVQDAPLTATGKSITANATVAFTGAVACFTDADPGATAGNFTTTINWGDGSTPIAGVVAPTASGALTIAGGHTYASAGTYAVTVTVKDAGGGTATAIGTATVAGSAPVITAAAMLGSAPGIVIVAASYSDAVAEHHTAVICWGDGTSSTVDLGSRKKGTFAAAHVYRSGPPPGGFVVTITVLDDDGTASAPVVFRPAPLLRVR